jgi:hypothetical protein
MWRALDKRERKTRDGFLAEVSSLDIWYGAQYPDDGPALEGLGEDEPRPVSRHRNAAQHRRVVSVSDQYRSPGTNVRPVVECATDRTTVTVFVGSAPIFEFRPERSDLITVVALCTMIRPLLTTDFL